MRTVIIGDRMDTDIIAGIESDWIPWLVLSGVTSVGWFEGVSLPS
jgi:ribonucleotide monophosphatase NagD (HAD superfamily)